MEKKNEILYKIRKYINNFKLDLGKVNKENIMSFIKGKKYLMSIILLLVMFFFMSWGKIFVTTKDELLNNLEVSMKKGDSRKVYGDIFVVDEKISRSELEPLIKYYNSDITKIDKIISELKTTEKSGVIKVKNKRRLIWQNYYLEVDTVGIKVNCNFEEAKIFLDNKEIDGGNVKRGLVPGLYNVKAQLKTDYGNVEKEVQVSLMQNEEVSIKLDATNLNITSNFNDAKVFINDKDTNKKVSEISNYGPIPTNENIEIQLQREFPWGVIQSDKVTLSDVPNMNIDINMVNEELTTQIEVSINKFYESIFKALNERDYNLITLTNEEIKKKIYEEINEKSLIFKNNYEISGLEVKIENSEFKYEDNKYKAQIVVKINYSIYKKLFLSSPAKIESMFLTNMELVGDEWIIEEVQKFDLE